MKQFIGFVAKAFVTGLLILVPVYLAGFAATQGDAIVSGFCKAIRHVASRMVPR